MANDYYSERVGAAPPRPDPTISPGFWAGFTALVTAGIHDGSFAQRYPEHCFEHPLPVATDSDALGAAFIAHNPHVPWPLQHLAVPNTLHVLDAIEFFAGLVSHPVKRAYHDFGRHHHILSFDPELGFAKYRTEINTMLRRCGHPFELDDQARVRRLVPPVIREELARVGFQTGDSALDELLETACAKFGSPDSRIRTEALEKLWDAWERLKTLLPGDKKTSVKALLASVVSEPMLRQRIDAEARELTDIGNAFMIRHHETNRVEITDSNHVDYLFHRMFALIAMIVRSRETLPV